MGTRRGKRRQDGCKQRQEVPSRGEMRLRGGKKRQKMACGGKRRRKKPRGGKRRRDRGNRRHEKP